MIHHEGPYVVPGEVSVLAKLGVHDVFVPSGRLLSLMAASQCELLDTHALLCTVLVLFITK